MLSLLSLSSFLFPMLKWLKLGWMRFHPNGLHLFFWMSRRGNQKAPAPQVFPTLTIVHHSSYTVRHPAHNWKRPLFLCEGAHVPPKWSTAFFEKNHITIPMVAAHGLWSPKPRPGQNTHRARPVPSPSRTQTTVPAAGWPLDEKARVLLAPHFSKSTLTLIVLANSLEFPSLPRRQSILWKWKLILTGGLSLGVFSIIYLKKKRESENSVAATNKPILIVNPFSRRWN